MRAASDVIDNSRRSSVGNVSADNNVPGPDPLKSPFNFTPETASGLCEAAAVALGLSHPAAESVVATTAHASTAVAIGRWVIDDKISAIFESC